MAAFFVMIPVVIIILILTAIYCGLKRLFGSVVKLGVIALMIAGYVYSLNGILGQENLKGVDGFMCFIYWTIGGSVITVIYWGAMLSAWGIASPFLWLNKATTPDKEETQVVDDDPELRNLLNRMK